MAAGGAGAAGITEWQAGLLPEDKTTEVAALREAPAASRAPRLSTSRTPRTSS
ncbi:MAG TPA: hypothetical protein VMU94_28585 [Streptosporangiaceae bacterium]|nr:hypothetical protein [Streptosporangiaceae bacterium]